MSDVLHQSTFLYKGDYSEMGASSQFYSELISAAEFYNEYDQHSATPVALNVDSEWRWSASGWVKSRPKVDIDR